MQYQYDTYQGFRPVQRNNVYVHTCRSPHEASIAAFLTLAPNLSRDTVLFCSMGNYLHELYELIVGFEPMPPSALVMFEEILGEPFHRASYERIYQERGFIDRVSKRGIPFYRILARSPTLMGTVRAFNSRVEELLMMYRRRHMFFELQPRGALGGIDPGFYSRCECDGDVMDEFVVGLRYPNDIRGRRVTVAFKTINYASNIWVFAFGKDIDKALKSFVRGARREYNNFPVGYLHKTGKDIHIFTDRQV